MLKKSSPTHASKEEGSFNQIIKKHIVITQNTTMTNVDPSAPKTSEFIQMPGNQLMLP